MGPSEAPGTVKMRRCLSWDRRGEQGEAHCQEGREGYEEGPPSLGCGV